MDADACRFISLTSLSLTYTSCYSEAQNMQVKPVVMRVNVTEQIVRESIERVRAWGTDDGLCEVKSCAKRVGASVWESVSAFANTDGGLIILGLDEKNGFAPSEQFDVESAISQFVEGMGDGGAAGAKLTNPPHYTLLRMGVEGGNVLAIGVAKNEVGNGLCYVTKQGMHAGAFRRVDDRDVRLTASEVERIRECGVLCDADRQPVEEADVSDLDDVLVDRLIDRLEHARCLRGTLTREERLCRLNIVNKAGNVLLGGLVALGEYPQQFLPRASIDVAIHPGVIKAQCDGLRFIDRETCEGPLSEAVATAVGVVMRNLRTCGVVRGIGRKDLPEVPEEVIREAIVNAVVHREYSPWAAGQAVVVDVYRNRISIVNPGGLWGGKTYETLGDGISRCRNPVLMNLVRHIPGLRGNEALAEGEGSGIGLMRRVMREAGLPEPRFHVTPDQFTIELARPGELAPQQEADGYATVLRLPCALAGGMSFERDADARGFRVAGAGVSYEKERARLAELGSGGDGATEGGVRGIYDQAAAAAARRSDPNYAHYYMTTKNGWVLEVLSETFPRGIREIADAGGKTVSQARRALRELVDAGEVVPTAPPTSRDRKYLRVQG